MKKLTEPGRNHSVFMSQLWDLFPKETIEHDLITALIVYRGPLIDHLKSTWKQTMTHLPENTTFYERLQIEREFEHLLGTIDSPLLAKTFLEPGYKVKILDMSGVSTVGDKKSDLWSDELHFLLLLNKASKVIYFV